MEYVLASLWKLNVLYSRSLRCYAGACVVALLVVGFLLVVFGGVCGRCVRRLLMMMAFVFTGITSSFHGLHLSIHPSFFESIHP